MDKEGSGFVFLQKFPRKSMAGIFDGPQIRGLIKDEALSEVELPPGNHWSQYLQTSLDTTGVRSTKNTLKSYWRVSATLGYEC